MTQGAVLASIVFESQGWHGFINHSQISIHDLMHHPFQTAFYHHHLTLAEDYTQEMRLLNMLNKVAHTYTMSDSLSKHRKGK